MVQARVVTLRAVPQYEDHDPDDLLAVNTSLAAEIASLRRGLMVQNAVEQRLRGAHEEAAGSAQVVEAMQDSALVGFASLDCNFRFLRVNETLARMNRGTTAAFAGRSVAEVVPGVWAQIEGVCRWALRTGEPVTDHEVTGDRRIGLGGNWLYSVYPVRVGGEIVGLCCLAVDVSRRAREEELREAVTETMVEGLFAIGPDGRATFVNAAATQMLGWSEAQLCARHVHDTIHFQDPDGRFPREADWQLTGVRTKAESLRCVDDIFTCRDGRQLPVTYSAAPLAHAEHGPGVVVVFRDSTEEQAGRLTARRELEAMHCLERTRDAIDEDRLVLYSQPIVPLRDGLPSEELLLRIIGRDGELIPPDTFLPAAEQYGLIEAIDRWVIAQAARIAATGRRIAINLSAKSVDCRLLGYIESELYAAAARPQDLIVELTETAIMGDVRAAERFARDLTDLGCGLALDDFGTGFASLTYLQILPVQYLKIDVQFVRDLPTDTTNQHLVKTIVSLAAGLGQQTVAEGVEDGKTLALLREYGVDYAQGFYLGEPVPVDPRA
ncbi:MAG: hypothetical protein QOI80_2278 [Solirubrobacteraceae bacterium]|nr:hypothetical protein [Solirubrobacteraceae bacterium]